MEQTSDDAADLYAVVHTLEEEVVSRRDVRRIALYFLIMMLFYSLGTPGSNGLAYIPIQYFMKDRLHFDAVQTANFNFITGAPLYIGFVLGYLRDRWRPFGKGDLGYLFLTPPLVAAGYLWLALRPLTYNSLVIATLLSTAFGVLLGAAIQGLMTEVAQRNAMAGRLAVVVMLTTNLPSVIAPWAGGWLTDHRPPQFTFFLTAVLMMVVTATAFWKPRSVFATATEERAYQVGGGSVRALLALMRHPSLYLPALIMFLWNFAPGWNTPLLYYLTNTAKYSAEDFGNFQAIQNIAIIGFAICYLPLCRRVRLITLLWWGTILGTVAAPLLLLIHNRSQGVLIAVLTGGTTSIALSAYYDLLMRACPKALEGAIFMLGAGMLALANQSSDVFGSWLYNRGGFGLALFVGAVLTALILPLLPFLPRHLVDYPDGEMRRPTPAVERGFPG
jgi:Na+/melibiose symporter-like transporter